MNKTDTFFLLASATLLSFVGGAYIADDYAIGALFATSGLLLTFAVLKAIPRRSKVPPYATFHQQLLLEGKDYSNRLLYLLLPPKELPQEDVYLADGDVTVVNSLGYGKMGEEAAAKLYRSLKRSPPPHLVVAVNEIDRNAASILSLVSQDVKIWKPNKLYRRLKKADLLEPIAKPKRKGRFWVNVFRPKHAWLFLVNAGALVAMSFFLPFRVYYYLFAAVNAALAMGVVLYNRFA